MLSMIVTVSSVTVFYSIENESSRRQIEQSWDFRKITIVPDAKVTAEALHSIQDNSELKIENIQLYSEEMKDGEFSYCLFSEMSPTQYNVYFGERISEANVQNADKVVVAPSYYLRINNRKVGDTVSLDGTDYKIIGENDLSNSNFEIPYTTLLNQQIADSISVILPQYTSAEEYQRVEEYIKSNTDLQVKSIVMSKRDEELDRRSSSDLQFSVFVFALAFINFTYLYRYILEKRKRTFSVFKILGCGNVRSFFVLLLEIIILYSVSFALGTLLSLLSNYVILPKLLDTQEIKLVPGDLGQLYVVILAVLTVGMAVLIGRFLKEPPITQLKESEE